MKLETFNAVNLPGLRMVAPSISVNSKSGLISFNNPAIEKLGLMEHMSIQFHHDEEQPGDWYVEIKQGGFVLRKNKSAVTKGALVIQSCQLVRKIFDSVNYTGTGGKMLIGAEPVKHLKMLIWPLITAKLVNTSK